MNASPSGDPPLDPRWRGVRRLLAVRLDNLGDVLMTTPALAALRASLPAAHLSLLASPSGAALAPHLPMVDETIAFDAPWVKSERAPGDPSVLVERLRARRFDAAVVFTVCTQSALPAALVCLQAGIPLRLAHSRENPYGLLTDWAPETDSPGADARHEVLRQTALVRRIGVASADTRLRFETRAADDGAMRERLVAAGGDPHRPWIVVHPGATAPSRRYPAERFGLAAGAAADMTGAQVVLAGGAGEAALAAEVRRALPGPAIDLVGRLSLGELASLIEGAACVLCNNSAPSHLAAALGTPAVVLYALTNSQHTPWQAAARVLNHDVPCRDCLKSVCPERHHACLLGVPAQAVAQAAIDLIGERRGAAETAGRRRPAEEECPTP